MNIGERLKNVKPEVWLIFILAFGAILRLIFFVGPCCDDDVSYLNSAYRIMKLNFDEFRNGYSFAYRTMMILPIALSMKIFGISEFSASLYIFLTSLGSIAVAYLIGKLLFKWQVGILAALLLSFYPLEVIYSTHIVPDVPLAFFLGLSVLAFVYAEKTNKNIFYLISGIIAGLSYLVKITGLVIFPFILIYSIFFIKKNKLSVFLRFLLGFLLIFLVETCYSYYFTGYPFTGYKSYISAQEAWGMMKERSAAEINSQLLFYPKIMFGSTLESMSPYFGFFFWLFLFAVLISFLYKKQRREFLIILIWFFSVFLYLQFGTMDLRSFVLIHRLTRFLTVLSIPLVLTIAYFLDCITKKKPFPAALLILALFISPLLVDSITRINSMTSFENNQTLGDVREIFKVLRGLPVKDVYFYQPTRDFGLLKFYFNFDEGNRLKLLLNNSCDSVKDAYVVTDDNRWFFEGGPKYPDCFLNPPENWELVATIRKADQGIYGKFDPKIYSVS